VTPGQYIALARDICLVVGISIILLLVYRSGQDRVKAGELKGLQTEIQQQAKTLTDWRNEANHANEQLSKDISAINSIAAMPVEHRWVRDTSCPKPAVLPAAARQTGEPTTAAGGVQPVGGDVPDGPRRDRIVAAFKQRWETEFAHCRALDAQWPQ
jgi:hypothetical protein